jgi:hypothetical protein
MNYFAVYAGYVFISTWVYQFLKFDVVKKIFGITQVENIPINGEFWGYTVLTDEQLLFRVIALSTLLVIAVLGNRTVNSKDRTQLNIYQMLDSAEVKEMNDDELYSTVLKQRENIFWSKITIFWPIINFCASFFHIVVMIVVVYQSLYWRLSWVMIIYLFFCIGPWYGVDFDFLTTRNLGLNIPLNYFSNIEIQKQRLKKWRMLMWITIIAWIVIFPSQKILGILNKRVESKLIFYGTWAGVLYPNTTPEVTFFNNVSGYLWILLFLVFEKMCLDWLSEEDDREEKRRLEETIGGRNNQKNYEILTQEIDRRQKIEDKKAGRGKNGSRRIGFQGLTEEGKIDPKEKLKQEIDDAVSKIGRGKKFETKKPHEPFLKSAMKKPSRNDGPEGPKPFEETMKSNELNGTNDSDDEFNILFTRDDPKMNEIKKLLLFQYKIKFMRGAKTLVEECITLALLICAVYKDNILSLIYYWMSIRMLVENVDMRYRMKVAFYVSIFAIGQYFLCLSNWNKFNSPLDMPIPFNEDHETSFISPPIPLPWVDLLHVSTTWKKYLLIDKNMDILHSILFETIVICLSAIYIYSFSPFLFNIDKKESRELLKVKSDLGKNKVFLDYVQSSSIFATLYKNLKSILYNTCHIFLILILLVLTSQNSGILAIGYLLFALFYLYKSLDLLMDKYWDYPEAIHTFKYYII